MDGTCTAYLKFPQVTGAATTAKYTVTYDGGTADKTVDQSAGANQGTWVSLGTFAFKQGNSARTVPRPQRNYPELAPRLPKGHEPCSPPGQPAEWNRSIAHRPPVTSRFCSPLRAKSLDMWVQRILEFIGWEPAGIPVDWEAIEREIGAPLPPDYKELSEAFGGGLFNDTVTFLAREERKAFNLVTRWRSALAADRDPRLGDVSAVTPYKIYEPGGKGLISWGSTEWGDEYFWFIDSAEPGKWPVLARAGDIDQWHTFDMSTSEFLYRVLADTDFRPFGVTQYGLEATFEPGDTL
ncbi:SMI1/KNR4 family protein [Streptomyces sp. MK5]|uniref:golvesin C-terminal-like domain-containing protein n=1 Tax=Streptomyces sp. MK5 TaxID=3064253 RepID=UPI0027422BB5|nr:SMI1/KNR4 family protein [Streptomyces sp. MK5]